MIKNLLRKFTNPILATDVIIFSIIQGELCVLLTESKKKEFHGMMSFPGGLVKYKEELETAAERHLKEKTGNSNIYLEQLYTFSDPTRDPGGHIVSTAYFALLPENKVKLEKGKDLKSLGWYPVSKLPKLAYDHKKMIDYAKQRLAWKLEYSNVVYSLLPEIFTLSELQDIYEIILHKEFDKRNFRKKLMSLGILKKLGKKREGDANRPAELFSFKAKKFEIVTMI